MSVKSNSHIKYLTIKALFGKRPTNLKKKDDIEISNYRTMNNFETQSNSADHMRKTF